MVDERAMAIVQECLRANVWTPWPLMAKRVVEAYEAARWRPIEEAKSDDGVVLVAWLGADSRGFGSAQLKVCPGETGGVRQWITNNEVIAETSFPNAMFRTIDPPTQDAVSHVTQPTKNERG